MNFEDLKEIVERVISKIEAKRPEPACIFSDCSDCYDSDHCGRGDQCNDSNHGDYCGRGDYSNK